ncbi:nAD+ synthetase [Clostridium sp. CAG:433]|jgi:NAD+ synthase (glutamine-hydrolysing)|nr:nAD+ synthetase [Clostridium sp. CAG:433]
MNEYGYVKVGASTLELKVSDTIYNVQMIKKQIDEAVNKNIQIISFPELSITGYTCGDLFNQDILIDKAYEGLKDLVDYSKDKMIVIIVGSPIKCENKLYNCAVVINNGKILGIVPKTYIPNYNEFYEMRWFKSSNDLKIKEINLFNEIVPIGVDLIFTSKLDDELKFGVEICEDVWSLYPKSNDYASSGASIIFNLSASNETIGKYDFRKELIKMQSIKTISGYVYSSSGINESSTDLLFSGSSLIYENGKLLSENNRFDFNSNLIYSDVDIKRLVNDRRKNTSFISNTDKEYRNIYFTTSKNNLISRKYSKYPFVPSNEDKREERCKEIINIQSSALAKRLKHTNIKKCVIGVSGGLDSTLAFLVIKKAFEKLKIDNKNIIAVTMPGFGTTNRTYENALDLIKINNATLKEIDIKKACLVHYSDIDQDINNHDITYENAQARERTKILMDIANKENALVIGTGDLSELALGWCTYNGDHMSMYSVNSSIPKTLVKYLVKYIADTDKKNKKVLYDILSTPISPELLPADEEGNIKQITEDKIGPYILHDFYLYHFFRYGASPKKIYMLAVNTFENEYSKEEILKWLKVFIKRFFTQQFKRSCMPDGVKVGSISLSPRGDLRMPSDASYNIWIKELEEI